MTEYAYAVVGREGSNHAAVGLDLAGAFATAGRETVLVELAPGPSMLLDLIDPDPDSLADDVPVSLPDPDDAPGATLRVGIEDSDVESLGVLATDPDDGLDPVRAVDPGEELGPDDWQPVSADDLPALLDALGGGYDVAVLAVAAGGVEDLSALSDPLDGCVAAVAADGDRSRATPRLVERLSDRSVDLDGVVVTDCAEEPELWTACSGIDADVLAVLPPVRPDRVDALGDRIRDVRDGLADTRGLFPDGPDLDEGRPVDSLAALLAGEAGRARVLEDHDPGPETVDGAYGAEGTLGDPATATDDGDDRPEGESWTDVPVDPGGDGPDATADGSDGLAFEFGKLPGAEGDGDGSGQSGADPDGKGDGDGGGDEDEDAGPPDTDDMVEAVSDILEGGNGEPADDEA